MNPQEPTQSQPVQNPVSPEPTPAMPQQAPEVKKNGNGMMVGITAVFILLALGAVAFFYYQNQQLKTMLADYQKVNETPQPTVITDPTANWKIFIHPTENYQFKYPSEWDVAINENAKSGVLFGPKATSKAGVGGIELREINTDPKDFNNLSESKIEEQKPLKIGNIDGYLTSYTNVVEGTNFVFKSDNGLVYNIYINSTDPEILSNFNQLLQTFKFIADASQANGTVTGKLCYPSEGLPPGEIVAKDTTSSKLFTQDYPGSQNGGDSTFSFPLPEGTYHLRYQAHASGNNPDVFISIYHTACAINNEYNFCLNDENHKIIPTKVVASQKTEGVFLCDGGTNSQQEQALESSF